MKRILLAADSQNIHPGTLDFACYIANLTRSKLTGAFISRSGTKPGMVPEVVAADTAQATGFEACINLFGEGCVSRETVYSICRDNAITADELVHESRFADMLIMDTEMLLPHSAQETDRSLVKNILHKSGCPVIFAPGDFDQVDEVIFTYDGSRSSMYAIKQFSYLFPRYRSSKVSVLQVRRDNTTPEENKFREWMRAHYDPVEYIITEGDPLGSLIKNLLPHRNAFIVMGAYGKSFIKGLLKPAIMGNVTGTIMAPVFIAHY